MTSNRFIASGELADAVASYNQRPEHDDWSLNEDDYRLGDLVEQVGTLARAVHRSILNEQMIQREVVTIAAIACSWVEAIDEPFPHLQMIRRLPDCV